MIILFMVILFMVNLFILCICLAKSQASLFSCISKKAIASIFTITPALLMRT